MEYANQPLVSIILPSYNHEEHVGLAIESVLSQSFGDYELLISDDCSSDRTVDVIRTYHDKRIQLHVYTENQGATINHKYLIDRARGKYVALINSDDLWLPKKLEKQVAYMESHPDCGACFSVADMIDENGNQIELYREVFDQPNRSQAEWYAHFFHFGNCLSHPSILIRTEIYRELGVYNLALRQLPDFDMWVRLIKHHSIYVFQKPLVQHRRFISSDKNTSAQTTDNSARDILESYYILIRYFSDVSDELFVEAFQKEFRKSGKLTHNELCCEKFFLLLGGTFYFSFLSQLAATNYFFDIYSQEGMAETFRKSYNFTMRDFHAISCQVNLQGLQNEGVFVSAPIVANQAKLDGFTKLVKSMIGTVFAKDSKFYLFCKGIRYRKGSNSNVTTEANEQK